jgi:hypothetical protein
MQIHCITVMLRPRKKGIFPLDKKWLLVYYWC